MSTFAYANLHPKYVFGINGSTKGTNVWFLDNSTLIYPAGNTVVFFNIDSKAQHFLHGVEKLKNVTALSVTNNKAYAAVAQIGEKGPTIVIFDLKSNKRKKTLLNAEVTGNEYISLAFTQDNLHLISLLGEPDNNIMVWKWDKGRMLGMLKISSLPSPLKYISTSPIENNVLCCVGGGVIRFYRYNDGHFKQFGYSRESQHSFSSYAWFNKGDKLIAGTNDGRLLFFEKGDYKYQITPILPVDSTHNFGKGDAETSRDRLGRTFIRKSEVISPRKLFDGKEITSIVTFSKGFIVAQGLGYVTVYEEQSSYEKLEDHYKLIYTIRIPTSTSELEDRVIKSLAINQSEESIIATTINNQIYHFPLATAEIKDEEEMIFEYANCSFHNRGIYGMSVATRKSLIATIGGDKFVRVWNFLSMTLEIAKEFAEDLLSVSIHPNGLFLLLGCSDKLRLLSILLDDLNEIRDFPIRGCRECCFNHGGSLFAIANGNVIQIYSTNTFENICNMKGHNNKIRKLVWSNDDAKLVSCGSDGAIYEWDIVSGKRSADLVERGTNILAAAISPDSKIHFSINTNRALKEIQIAEGMVLKEVDLAKNPTTIKISRSGNILIAGFEDGTCRSLRLPLTYSGEWTDYHLHVDRISEICITYDEVYCVTCSDDNTIIFWKMTDPEGRVSKLEKETFYSTEILVTKSELDEKQMLMNEMKQKLGEQKMESDYTMKRKEMSYQEELRDLHVKYCDEIERLNERIKGLLAEKASKEDKFFEFIKNIKVEHQNEIQNLEAHYNKKILNEYEGYNKLQKLLETTVQEYETRVSALESERGKSIDDLVQYYDGKVKDKNEALELAYDDARSTLKIGEEMKLQIEEDADSEILEITNSYEKKLKQEREINRKLKGEAGIMRKKFITMQREIEDQKSHSLKLVTEGSKMKTVIQMSEKEITTLRKDLVDRDNHVHDKEKIIFDLKKTNNELEKFKFVLDHKIKELKKRIEPKDREISYLKQQNGDMESELEQTIALRNGLELQVNELSNKLKITEGEYQREKRMRWRLSILVFRIRAQLSRGMANLENHKLLKTIIKNTYTKYGQSVKVPKGSGSTEQEAICELVRQKTHLEMSLHSIKKQVTRDVDFTRNDQMKIMHENMLLVYEINNLRKELKNCRDRITNFENALGVNQGGHPNETTEMRLRLHLAIQDKDELNLSHERDIEEKVNLIKAQQNEIDTLNHQVLKVQEKINEFNPSGRYYQRQ